MAFISESKSLDVVSLHLPLNIRKFNSPAHWLCRVIKYIQAEQKIFVEILEYHHDHSDFLPFQQEGLEWIESLKFIDFRGINTNKLLITANGIKETKSFIAKPIKKNEEDQALTSFLGDDILEKPPAREETYFSSDFVKPNYKSHTTERSECQVAWKDLKFDFGAVLVTCKVKKLHTVVDVKIYNEHLRVEFDAIKNYFSKILAINKVKINLTLSLEQGVITKIYATSKEIDRINPAVIESIKFEIIRGLPKKKFSLPVDKSLFTMDDYFQTAVDPHLNAATFYSSEKQLFEDILKITTTKHYKNLRFLSEHHAYKVMKLRFILKPFSFVFLLEGERAYHVVWETLNTKEATYIWHADKNIEELKRTLRHIEEIINAVKFQGKSAYLQSSQDHYHRIHHDYSALIDGFVKWKCELESILF